MTPFILAEPWEEKQIHSTHGYGENKQLLSSHVDRSHGFASQEPQSQSESAPVPLGLHTLHRKHPKAGSEAGELCDMPRGMQGLP